MSGSVGGDVRAEPNLTPLLDIVFQLITFFMLVINFSSDNYDQRVRLPVAGSAKPVEGAKASDERLVLNVDRDGNLLWNGKILGIELAGQEINTQAQLIKLNLKSAGKALKPGENLPTTIVIRADRTTPFSQLYRLITICQTNGFTKFALKAMNAES